MTPCGSRGVSNTLGVVTLVGVVVVVAATTGLLSVVFYTPPPVVDDPDTTIAFDYDRGLTDGDNLTIEHTGGDTLHSDRVRIEIAGTNDPEADGVVYWANLSDRDRVSEGDRLVLDQTTLGSSTDRLDLAAARVDVVAEGETQTYTIEQWNGPDA